MLRKLFRIRTRSPTESGERTSVFEWLLGFKRFVIAGAVAGSLIVAANAQDFGCRTCAQVVTYRPVVIATPMVTYRPVTTYEAVTTYRPVTTYKPTTTYCPVTTYRPTTVCEAVSACAPTVCAPGTCASIANECVVPTVVLRPVFVPGEPIRNFFRALAY